MCVCVEMYVKDWHECGRIKVNPCLELKAKRCITQVCILVLYTSWEVRAANGRSSLSLAVRKCSILLPLPCNPITPAVRPKPHNNVILLRTLNATACPRPGLPHALAHFLLLFFDTSSCPCYDTIFLLADPFPPPPRAHLLLPL